MKRLLDAVTTTVRPPALAVRAALALALPLSAALGLVGWLGSPVVLLGAFLGVLAGIVPALTTLSTGVRATIGLAVVLGATLGTVAGGRVWVLALVLAGLGLCQIPLSRCSAGLGAMTLVVPAVVCSLGVEQDAWTLGAAAAGGFVAVNLLVAALTMAAPAQPVPADVARRHGIALAVAAAACAPVVTADFGHGYWLVLTVAAVLRPVAAETRAMARDRTIGALAGIVLAAVIVLLLPTVVAVLVAIGCVIGNVAWMLARDELRATFFGTPVVVLIASSGAGGDQVSASLERIALVSGGALLAVAATAALAFWELRPGAAGGTLRSGG